MAKEAIDKIREAEIKADVLIQRAIEYMSQTLKKAEQDSKDLFSQKKNEAAIAASDIVKEAEENAAKYVSEASENGNKELHVLKESVLGKTDAVVKKIIELL